MDGPTSPTRPTATELPAPHDVFAPAYNGSMTKSYRSASARACSGRKPAKLGGLMLARYGILVGTVLVATMAPSGRASASTPLSCGDTITRSVVLTGDLNCAGDGLVIDADGVTI